jgi:signal recognition particle subunit SRP54
MFNALADRLQKILGGFRSRARLNPAEIESGLREIRIALLEADVNLKVARGFVTRLKDRLIGESVGRALTPAQTIIKLVHEELVAVLGGDEAAQLAGISYAGRFSPMMLVGLQGSGKTTTAGKLALRFKNQGQRPLLVGLDLKRPAAMEQVSIIAEQVGVAAYSGKASTPVELARAALTHGRKEGFSPVLLDTAGRLQIDEELMDELTAVRQVVEPLEVFLVADAMTGQEAVNIAQTFNEKVALTGVILSKFDSDTRGGAALSIRETVGTPIRFVGTGEKFDAIEPFYPERWAGRILGMGDVVTLVEKVEESIEEQDAEAIGKRLAKERFTLEDFMNVMEQTQKMGPISQMLKLLPGFKLNDEQIALGERELVRVKAIVRSMTPRERRDPGVLNASRRRRIALGSGNTVQDINRFMRQFREMQKVMKRFKKGKLPLGKMFGMG